MPANKHKAQQFIDNVSRFASEERRRLELSRDDITLNIRVEVTDVLTYVEHEDED